MTKVLDHHAPLQKKIITPRDKRQGYNEDMKSAKREQRRLERRWRKTRLPADRDNFVAQKLKLRKMLEDADTKFYSDLVMNNSSNPRALFKVFNNILNKQTQSPLPPHESPAELADEFASFFTVKIDKIQEQIQETPEDRKLTINQQETCKFDTAMMQFVALSEDSVRKILKKAPIKSCELDPLPSWVLRKCEDVFIRIITLIVNRSFEEDTPV